MNSGQTGSTEAGQTQVAAGQPNLSDRELEILKLVATGATNQQVARDLFISVNTVKVHLRNIFAKLGVESRTEATTYAIRQGWIVVPFMHLQSSTEEPPAPVRERIALWQRAFFLAAAGLVALAVFLPPSRQAANGGGGQFTDRPETSSSNSSGTTSSRWVIKAQMPTARSRLAVAAVGGLVYAIAGDTTDGVTGIVEVYDPAEDTWTRKTAKPRAVRNIAAAVLGGRIFVPGGYDATDQAITAVDVCDPATDSWSETAPLPQPLCAYAIATWSGRVFLFGGSDGIRYLDSVLIYDPLSDAWTQGTPLSRPRGFAAAVTVGDRIFLVGGYDGQDELSLCEEYQPAREGSGETPWTARQPMTAARGGLAAVAAEGYVYALGGGWTSQLTYNERYDVEKDVWTSFDSPLLGQWRTLGAAPVEARDGMVLHTVGGWSNRHLSSNYAYQVFFRIYLPDL